MSFFKKLGSGAGKIFNKATGAVANIFKKGGNLAQDVSKGIGKVSNVLGNVADIGGKILSNPLTQALATGVGSAFGVPEAGAMLGQAGNFLGQVKRGSEIAGRASKFIGNAGALATQASKYQSPADVMGGIQKAKDLYSEGRGVAGPSFV
jgi:hypothetical protein